MVKINDRTEQKYKSFFFAHLIKSDQTVTVVQTPDYGKLNENFPNIIFTDPDTVTHDKTVLFTSQV